MMDMAKLKMDVTADLREFTASMDALRAAFQQFGTSDEAGAAALGTLDAPARQVLRAITDGATTIVIGQRVITFEDER